MKTQKNDFVKTTVPKFSALAFALLVLPALTFAGSSFANPTNVSTVSGFVSIGGADSTSAEEEFKGILTQSEWDTLSLEQIDAKLKAAGKKTIGDPKDPLYKMTPAQIGKLTPAQWEKIVTEDDALYGHDSDFDTDEFEFKGILTQSEWNTFSLEQIDAKLKAAGKETIGDPKDPLYKMTPAKIDKLTEAEWAKIEADYRALYGDESDSNTLEDELSAGNVELSEWDALSLEQIDAKLKAAGKETIGDPKDPLYKMTPAQIDKLTDAQWEKIEAEYQVLYGDESSSNALEDGSLAGNVESSDWDTLSLEQIDAKLKAAGKETIGNTNDPLYKMTPAQIDKLTDAQWEKIEMEHQALYQ